MELHYKKVNFLGDSITEGSGVSDIANCRYDNRLKAKYSLTTNNYGIGGTRLAHQMTCSENPRWDLCFSGRAYNLDPTADITIVYGGVNDYLHGNAPFGEEGDTTPATFVGAVHFLMNLLKTMYPTQKFVFMTPARCVFYGGDFTAVSKHPNKRADARPLADYVRVIVETGKKMGIPVLNLYENLDINPMIEEERVALTADGLHFNDEGHARLASLLEAFLLSLPE
ncbi:MAG: SGNH/GDSL hydrolase family protein [Clostridia bacterium]|nr:SGNH/GDSL hydrolase family protein [Clostridia bacterium]